MAQKKATPLKSKTIKKKISLSIEKELDLELEAYIKEKGYSKNDFIVNAIKEKISKDKISSMIDSILI